ncbi:MAG: hypothetical protein KGS49_01590 [Planctomycetes bacterium]|nr:hypothetical protein [Planctomycetota bacterium]
MESLQVVLTLAVAAVVLTLVTHFSPTIWNYFNRNKATSVATALTASTATMGPAAKQPTLLENALVLGALFAVIGWSAKEMVVFVRLRAELAILEVLSDKQQRTYTEIIDDVMRNPIHKRIRFIRGSVTDALASLVSNGKLTIDHGRYAVAAPKTEQKTK